MPALTLKRCPCVGGRRVMATKVSDELREKLAQPDAAGMLEVIIELHDSSEPLAQQDQSRQEKIAAMRESFIRDVAPIEDAVQRAGGEVTGHAWINRTLRARVPAGEIEQLAVNEQIARIDMPHKLELEHLDNVD